MSERKKAKIRKCRSCNTTIHIDAAGLKEHARVCGTMKQLGLVTPGALIEPPKPELVSPTEPLIKLA